MSRYINTEWLENNAKEYSLGYYEADEWATPLSVLDSAPSIDIVRCRECKHFHKEGITDKSYYCKQFHDRNGYWREVNPDDFCSYGEREGE